MSGRVVYLLGALFCGACAFIGVQPSGADFTDTTRTTTTVGAAADWTAPLVAVVDPGGVVFGGVTITATASDQVSAVASVEIEYAPAGSGSWVSLCTDTDEPYSCAWDTTTVADGDYDLRARATDSVGYTTTSAIVVTSVANVVEVVLAPVPSPVRGTVTLQADLVNAYGPRTITFQFRPAGSATWQDVPGCAVGTSSSHACSFDTSALSGLHDFRAVGTRAASTYTDAQAGVMVDNTAPSVDLTVPAGFLTGPVDLTATAADAHAGLTSLLIEHRLVGAGSWTTCGGATTSPYVCSLDTTTLEDGDHQFRATAIDAAGNTTTTAIVDRTVSNAPASVTITSPTGGSVTGTVPITATATSDRPIASVRIDALVDGSWTAVCTDSSPAYSCSWNTAPLADGSYELRAVLTETNGTTVISAGVSVTVNHPAPTVEITSPAAGSTVTGTVTVQATGASSQGVTSIRIETRPAGGTWTPLCTDSSSPYSCPWNTSAVAYGGYELRAVLTQGDGATVTSSIVPVSVDNVVGSVVLTSPTAGNVRGTVAIAADASSNAGVTAVSLEQRVAGGTWAPVCIDNSSPYACGWDTSAIAYGVREVRAVMTQGNGAILTSAVATVTVDNRVLAAADVQAGNQDGTPGSGDTVTLTYTGLVDLSTIRTGLSSTPSAFTGLGLKGGTGGVGNVDRLLFPAGINLGEVRFTQNYVNGNNTLTFAGSMISATTVTVGGMPVTQVTITMGTAAGSIRSTPNPGTMTWVPSTTVRDNYGTASTGGTATESGPADADL